LGELGKATWFNGARREICWEKVEHRIRCFSTTSSGGRNLERNRKHQTQGNGVIGEDKRTSIQIESGSMA